MELLRRVAPLAQLRYLIRGGFLADLTVVEEGPNQPPFNEFHVALQKRAAAGSG